MNLLKCRTRTIMTRSKLNLFYPLDYPSPNCIICPVGQDNIETCTHCLLGCKNKKISGMITDRHNEACHMIRKAIKRDKKGGAHILINAGIKNDHAQDDTTPEWLVRKADIQKWADLHNEDLPEDKHINPQKLDMIVIEGKDVPNGLDDILTEGKMLRSPEWKIHIIEVGYCWDTRWLEKCDEKEKKI